MNTHPDYEVQSLLQTNTHSTLYRALKLSDRQHVIIKVINSNPRYHSAQSQLAHEYSVGKKLKNAQGVAQAIDLITLGETHALVMKDFGTCSLQQFAQGTPLETALFLKIAIGVAESLQSIHDCNVLHKDIKPGSILIHPKTLEIWVSDFGLASVLPFVEQMATSHSLITGTYAYLAPEQTGRMNRSIDARADLYSLGITFFEMLTGKLPFVGKDALEWFHLHIAVEPDSPQTIREELPVVLCALILKLLAKAPEDRYQSAFGLKRDLEICLAQYVSTGLIESFPLGEADKVGKIQIPQKLYGRSDEVSIILQAFANVSVSGQSELVLVSGYSGVGKTSLVNELHKPVVEKRALFISGKFDQYRRGVPYATIARAFRDLVNQLLTGSEEELLVWKERIANCLGPNANLVFGVIPELELVLGKQPAVVDLAPAENINRFNLTFQAFVRVFARPEHPLVLFLDDMQWADGATLGLIEKILTNPEIGSLLLVLAYRDNEVDDTHPFSLTLQKLSLEEKPIHNVVLKPLGLEHVNQLVSDSIKRPALETTGLSRLIFDRTAGNPFFVIEFLKNLDHEKLLTFDLDQRRWLWDEEKISARNMTDNVVHLMSAKVERLPGFAKRALMLASCVGSEFDRTTLGIVLEMKPDAGEIECALEPAVESGMIISILDQRQERDDRQTFRFQHDRIQQAAYSLFLEEERKGIHLKIGRLLFGQLNAAGLEERLFEVVDQFNHALDLMTDSSERAAVMNLNFRAGNRAKESTAYHAALKYFSHTLELSSSNIWVENHAIAFNATVGKGECEYLLGNIARGEELFKLVLEKANSVLDQARVYQAWLNLCQFSGKYTEGLDAGIEGLKILGIHLPDSESLPAAIIAENQIVESKLKGRSAMDCLDLPVMTDPSALAALELLAACGPSAFMSRPELFPLIDLKMINLSLQFGNAPTSGFAYSMYAMLLVSPYGRVERANEFSRMSIEFNRRIQDSRWKGMIVHIHANHIGFWKNRFESSLPYIDEAFSACVQAGDFVTSNYIAFMSFWLVFESGKPLQDLNLAAERFASFTKQSRNIPVFETLSFYQQFVRNLRGDARFFESFNDEVFSEKKSLAVLEKSNFLPGVLLFHLSKTISHYVLGQYGEARRSSEQSYQRRSAGASLPAEATVPYYHALSLAADFESFSIQEQEDAIKRIREIAIQLSYWAENAPENYAHKHAFVLAELARVEGRFENAVKHFSEAIEFAGRAKIIQDEALIYERLSSLYFSHGIKALAETHLKQAFLKFQEWGATAKIRQLKKLYPHLFMQLQNPFVEMIGVDLRNETQLLDLKSVMKAAQAISQEIEINRLMAALIRILIENAGAQKGALFLVKEENIELAALADLQVRAGNIEVRVEVQPNKETVLAPQSLLNFVRRTKKKVLLEDATTPNLFSQDEYLKEARPKSVLCIPILKLQEMVAILYLENALISGAFTQERITLLELLSSQAAISLENARLFKETQVAAELRISLDREKNLSAERELARGELHGLFMQAPVGIALFDGPTHIFTLANSSYLSLFFTLDHDLIGKSVIEVAKEAENKGYLAILDGVYQTGNPYVGTEVPLELHRVDGSVDKFFINCVYQARRDNEGKIAGILAVISNATEQVTVRQKIEESLRSRDEFLSIASHELKTPVTSLKMQLQMTRRGVRVDEGIAPPPAKLAKTLNLCVRQVDRLSALIDDLLDVTRVESGKMTYNFEMVELSGLVEEVIERFSEQLQAAECKLKIRLAEKTSVICDRFRIEQVVTNLITNAMKYGAGSSVKVSVEASTSGSIISVSDSGMGIAKEKHTKIFDRFERAISHDNISGLGLGLYITKQIMSAHGGNISLESELGKGSTFTVELLRFPKAPGTSTAPAIQIEDKKE